MAMKTTSKNKSAVTPTVPFDPNQHSWFNGNILALEEYIRNTGLEGKILLPRVGNTSTTYAQSMAWVTSLLQQTTHVYIRTQAYASVGNFTDRYQLGAPKQNPAAERIWVWVSMNYVGEYFGSMDIAYFRMAKNAVEEQANQEAKNLKALAAKQKIIDHYRKTGKFQPEERGLKTIENIESKILVWHAQYVETVAAIAEIMNRLQSTIGFINDTENCFESKISRLHNFLHERVGNGPQPHTKNHITTPLIYGSTGLCDGLGRLLSVQADVFENLESQQEKLLKAKEKLVILRASKARFLASIGENDGESALSDLDNSQLNEEELDSQADTENTECQECTLKSF